MSSISFVRFILSSVYALVPNCNKDEALRGSRHTRSGFMYSTVSKCIGLPKWLKTILSGAHFLGYDLTTSIDFAISTVATDPPTPQITTCIPSRREENDVYDSSTQLCSTISRTRRLYSRLFSLNNLLASEFAGEAGLGSHKRL